MGRAPLGLVGSVVFIVSACSSASSPAAPTPAGHDAGGRDAREADAVADGARAHEGDATEDSVLGGRTDALVEAAVDSGGGWDAGVDGGVACEWGGAPGTCMTLPACAAPGDHSSYANECPGPASVECCIVTPSVSNNPPTPQGYEPMQQSQVTSAMTTWAVAILNDPQTYPMFATSTQTFGTQLVLARVEWHPPDFQNSVVHRGVTLYVPG